MRPLIVLPVIHNETAVKCIDSMGVKVQFDNLLIVDNSPDKFTKQWPMADDLFHIERPEGNIGVGRAWNIGVDYMLKNDFDFLIILSASVVFKDGGFSLFDQLEKNKHAMGLQTQEGWHCIALSKSIFKEIGNFDTNFYPAYYEDSDFIRRMELAKIHEPCGTIHMPATSIEVFPAEVAHGMKKGNVHVNMQACANYFLSKWGAMPAYDSQASRDKMFKHPFDNPSYDLSYYPERTIKELKLLYNLA